MTLRDPKAAAAAGCTLPADRTTPRERCGEAAREGSDQGHPAGQGGPAMQEHRHRPARSRPRPARPTATVSSPVATRPRSWPPSSGTGPIGGLLGGILAAYWVSAERRRPARPKPRRWIPRPHRRRPSRPRPRRTSRARRRARRLPRPAHAPPESRRRTQPGRPDLLPSPSCEIVVKKLAAAAARTTYRRSRPP